MPLKPDHSVTLNCTLCCKMFSDLSHLLTHVSSKSHLAQQFKLQIRARSEPDVKGLLDRFSIWYTSNGIDVMLAERVDAKERKKAKKARSVNIGTKKEKDNDARLAIGFAQVSASAPIPASTAQTPPPAFRAPVPRMHLWPIGNVSPKSTPVNNLEDEPLYSTPTARREVPNFMREETVDYMLDPKLTTPWKPTSDHDEEVSDAKAEGKLSDNSKLKGIFWPGMALFDSATPEMKRMRNQRKDSNVLDQMIATSIEIEPAEVSFHPNGEFRASRDIFGPLSTESSPVRAVRPSPKKRMSRNANAMADVSVNVPRMQTSRRKKQTTFQSLQNGYSSSMQTLPPMSFNSIPTLNPLAAGFSRRFITTAEEDEEFKLTVGNMKKRGFDVFREATTAVSPGRTESPLEDHRFDFGNHGLPQCSHDSMNSSNYPVSPTPVARQASFQLFGQENQQFGRPTFRQTQRPASTPSQYPPQTFYDSSINPLYNHVYARSYSYNHSNYNTGRSPSGFESSFSGEFKQLEPGPIDLSQNEEQTLMGKQGPNSSTAM